MVQSDKKRSLSESGGPGHNEDEESTPFLGGNTSKKELKMRGNEENALRRILNSFSLSPCQLVALWCSLQAIVLFITLFMGYNTFFGEAKSQAENRFKFSIPNFFVITQHMYWSRSLSLFSLKWRVWVKRKYTDGAIHALILSDSIKVVGFLPVLNFIEERLPLIFIYENQI